MNSVRDKEMVVVTGASGFIGRHLCHQLEECGRQVRRIVREPTGDNSEFVIGDIGSETDWSAALENVDCIIHTAGRAHQLKDSSDDPITEFREVNTSGSYQLAEQAANRGIRRLIFLSSVGVLGNFTEAGRPFDSTSVPAPLEDYAVSKWEAEKALAQVARNSDLEIVIIRPPLVYGPNAPGNFHRLVRLIKTGVPLPFGLIHNQRSLVAIYNLNDLIVRCIDHPSAAGETFLISDGHDVSTPELIRKLAHEMGKRPRLLPVPSAWLRLAAKLVGKSPEINRLINWLQVDIQGTCRTLDWAPPFTAEECLQRTVVDEIETPD